MLRHNRVVGLLVSPAPLSAGEVVGVYSAYSLRLRGEVEWAVDISCVARLKQTWRRALPIGTKSVSGENAKSTIAFLYRQQDPARPVLFSIIAIIIRLSDNTSTCLSIRLKKLYSWWRKHALPLSPQSSARRWLSPLPRPPALSRFINPFCLFIFLSFFCLLFFLFACWANLAGQQQPHYHTPVDKTCHIYCRNEKRQ